MPILSNFPSGISDSVQQDINAKQPKITASGLLKGDGNGNITAAEESQVELVELVGGENINVNGNVISTKAFPCNPNLLDNWYFGNPVNQRGQTSYPGGAYAVDRWLPTAGNESVSVGNGYLTVTSRSSGAAVDQPMEMVFPVGTTLTLSALMRCATANAGVQCGCGQDASGNNIYSGTGKVKGTGGWELVSVTFAIPDSVKTVKLSPRFRATAADTAYDIRAIKLELGSVQTLAHQENDAWVLNEIPDYGEQLRRCQRYLRPAGTQFITSQASGNIYGSTSLVSSYPMRAVPRIVNADYMGIEVREVTGGVAGTITNVFTPNINGSFTVQLSGTSMPNYVYIDPTGFNPLLSAEL